MDPTDPTKTQKIDEGNTGGVGRPTLPGECNRRSATGYRLCLERAVEHLKGNVDEVRSALTIANAKIERQKAAIKVLVDAHDDPQHDGTESGSPAWWRGESAGAGGVAKTILDILAGKKKAGRFNHLMMNQIRDHIHVLLQTKNLHERINRWTEQMFGKQLSKSRLERSMRIIEEAVELAQSEGIGPEQVRKIVRYVYGRPVGDPQQEGAGLYLCILAWAGARGFDVETDATKEMYRIETIDRELVRQKQTMKAKAGIALKGPSLP